MYDVEDTVPEIGQRLAEPLTDLLKCQEMHPGHDRSKPTILRPNKSVEQTS